MKFVSTVAIGNSFKVDHVVNQMLDKFICFGCGKTGEIRRDEDARES